MKHYMTLALAALVLVLAAPNADAIRIRVVDAPIVDCTALSALDPDATCSITDPSDTYAMSFVPAAGAGCQSAAAIPNVDISGFNFCILLTNLTGAPLTSLNFSFVVPTQGANDDYNNVFCDGFPNSVSSSFCPSAPLHVGDTITASFSADPGVPHRETAYLFVDFENDPGSANVTVSVPEPGALGLFGLGLLAIGVGYGWEKRRQRRVAHTAR